MVRGESGGQMRCAVRALLLTALLPACGGGESAGDGSAIVNHEAQVRALDAAAARLADLDPTSVLPGTGTAVYAGHFGATADLAGADPLFVTAEVSLTARFGPGTIDGRYSKASAAGGGVSGQGAFVNGTIGPAGIDAEVTGTLITGARTHNVVGTFRGTFLGPGAGALGGGIETVLTRNGSVAGRLDGELWAEK
jgi:hypothetical protein